ncbi:MAG: methylcobalamin:coenzyme M methyltransferase [candidate division BRC1 bacterium ADurb.BinA364]|nr:MAG: methylcobalamin:coenzyme M methyltransferase [candidate division BRC1 bacterium ADurb.BinA364]
MNALQRFSASMEYQPLDRVPNWEAGAWPQTWKRWEDEGAAVPNDERHWFYGCDLLGLDRREFIHFNGQAIPPFRQEVLESSEEYEILRDSKGRVRKALKAGAIGGARMSMDQYLRFAVETPEDWAEVKKRFDPRDARRYEANWREVSPAQWKARQTPLIFAPNTQTMGFYWVAREFLGTENLSYAWYDQPGLMHDMMEFWADFLIEAGRPILEATDLEYICLAEDMAMKSGPLLSPATYKEFIFPRLKRVIEFYKSNGTRYICIDTDGNPEALIPLLLDAGVDCLWPLERAAEQDPIRLRRKFGRSLRLWGAVDKRELAKGPAAIAAHLKAMRPLIEEGGFIPTVDHTVPPDVSWSDFQYYMEAKRLLLRGELR